MMAPQRYTELFFLDEVTALAAGHRPCFECRRSEAHAFAAAWALAVGLSKVPRDDEMDSRLHAERTVSKDASMPIHHVRPVDLPNGAMVASKMDDGERTAWLVLDGTLWRWSFAGYEKALPIEEVGAAELITAPSIVAVLAAGYQPRVHRSANRPYH